MSELRFESAIAEPMTACDASTLVVEPPHVYVKAGELPPSVHATEHLSMTSWRPFVVSVSSSELGDAVVVSVVAARSTEPELVRSTVRCIVSPGATSVALRLSRFVEAPVAPRATVTVPVASVFETDVELVNDAC